MFFDHWAIVNSDSEYKVKDISKALVCRAVHSYP